MSYSIPLNPSATKSELINDAIAFTKYAASDFTSLEYINNILGELKYNISNGEFVVFKERINQLIKEGDDF